MSIRYLIGDVFDRMGELADDSIDLILTSPPFLALRSYLPVDHPDKHKEIGSEATPAEYIDVLLRLTAEWRRLLAPHGSLVVELGDTYSGSGGAGGDYDADGLREGQPTFKANPGRAGTTRYQVPGMPSIPARAVQDQLPKVGSGWPLAKSLTLIPESYRFALVYGINPHTGTPSPAGQWRVRNVVRWVRPNPPVGALGDKFRPATSELVVAATSKDRWFDLDAVREPASENTNRRNARAVSARENTTPSGQRDGNWNTIAISDDVHPAGAPPLDWWQISPKGYSGAHYAVFPSELCVKPIQAMCPRQVCRTCGQPRRRITDVSYVDANGQEIEGEVWPSGMLDGNRGAHTHKTVTATRQDTTVGWSDCGHDDYRPGLVLDPFVGTGTTLAVAHGHGRDAIGIDIDERSAELARDRVGPLFLEIEYA